MCDRSKQRYKDRVAVEVAIGCLRQLDGWPYRLAVEMMEEALALCREQCDHYPRHAPNCQVDGARAWMEEARDGE